MSLERRGDWIQVGQVTKRAFYPLDPRAEDVCIEDIAHALAMQCRWTGHCPYHYSVAQHSYYVSYTCPPVDALWGLLHDASEAYVSDVARPLKHSPEWAPFREAEQKILRVIANKFDLPWPEPASVKTADTTFLGCEALQLMSPLVTPDNWKWCTDLAPVVRITIQEWMPRQAETLFLNRYRELTGQQ